MSVSRAAIIVAFVVVLGVPFVLRPARVGARVGAGVEALVAVTPHVPQIRSEFAAGFSRWHERRYGVPAAIDWRVPGGTSEIIAQLEAQYQAVVKNGGVDFSDAASPRMAAGAVAFDLVFGGGSYDHGRIRSGVKGEHAGRAFVLPMSEPAGFAPARMDEWFGKNEVGAQPLYEKEQYWIGVALSGFGIVYNTEVLARLGVPTPTRFDDLADPRLIGMVVLADPRQSGSVATTLDSILNNYGWERGWRLIREVCGNARTFTNSAPKPPIDVSQGEAAAGLAIDFYGRGQSQAVLAPGQAPEESRVGYVDPAGATYIDADPVSILRGGPHPELARRFVEFCLSDEGQALWQMPAKTDPRSADNPVGEGGERLGPAQYELRRMPARRAMYDRYSQSFIDKANPFEVASTTKTRGWRGTLGVMMGAFAMDNAHVQREAWKALCAARADGACAPEVRERLEALYFAFPKTIMDDGRTLDFEPENVKAITDAWKKSPTFQSRCEIYYTGFFRENYEQMIALAHSRGVGGR